MPAGKPAQRPRESYLVADGYGWPGQDIFVSLASFKSSPEVVNEEVYRLSCPSDFWQLPIYGNTPS